MMKLLKLLLVILLVTGIFVGATQLAAIAVGISFIQSLGSTLIISAILLSVGKICEILGDKS